MASDFATLAKWYAFFGRPSMYVHPSRIPQYAQPEILRLLSERKAPADRVHYHLSRLILEKHPELSLSTMRIPADVFSLLTASIKKLHAIAFVLGSLETGQWLRRIIDGPTLAEVTKIIGPQLLHFVRTRYAGFYKGSRRWSTLSLEDFPSTLEQCGYAFLYKAGMTLTQELRGVWSLRMPTDLHTDLAGEMPAEELMKLCLRLNQEVVNIFRRTT